MNARAAAAGVPPAVLYADRLAGVTLTRHVDGRTMTPELFRATRGAGAGGGGVPQLHASGARFAFRFELFAMIEDYLKLLAEFGRDPAGGVSSRLWRRRAAVQGRAGRSSGGAGAPPLRPALRELLDTGVRMWIVDWEYLGDERPALRSQRISRSRREFGPEADEELLAAYFGGAPRRRRGAGWWPTRRCATCSGRWGLIQHANGNPAEDFWAYAPTRFGRCQRLMGSDGFARHLQGGADRRRLTSPSARIRLSTKAGLSVVCQFEILRLRRETRPRMTGRTAAQELAVGRESARRRDDARAPRGDC